MLLVAREDLIAPVVRVAGRIDADMLDAELGPHAVVGVVAGFDLGAEVHGMLLPKGSEEHKERRCKAGRLRLVW